MMVTFQIQGSMDMVVLDTDKGPPIKVSLMLRFQSSTTISLKKVKRWWIFIVLLVLGVERSMRINAKPIEMVALAVARVVTR